MLAGKLIRLPGMLTPGESRHVSEKIRCSKYVMEGVGERGLFCEPPWPRAQGDAARRS